MTGFTLLSILLLVQIGPSRAQAITILNSQSSRSALSDNAGSFVATSDLQSVRKFVSSLNKSSVAKRYMRPLLDYHILDPTLAAAISTHRHQTSGVNESVLFDAYMSAHKHENKTNERVHSRRQARANSVLNDAICGTDDLQMHGGGTMNTGPINLYGIWVGTSVLDYAPNSSRRNLMGLFMEGLGTSDYFSIITSYTDASGKNLDPAQLVSNTPNHQTFLYVEGGTIISDNYIQWLIAYTFLHGRLPADSNAIYAVFLKGALRYYSDLVGGYFGPHWCGLHYGFSYRDADGQRHVIKYVVVPDPSYTPSGFRVSSMNYCSFYLEHTASANRYASIDAMVNVLAHEVAETISDPYYQAWYNPQTCEVADMCAWNFGPLDSNFNTQFNGRKWLLQQLWLYDTPNSRCALCHQRCT